MRDRMERLPTFPFSVGCVSKSSVDVVDRQLKNSLAETNPPPSQIQLSNGRMKSSLNLPLPKPNISAGIQKVIKGFKSLSYLFQFRKEDDDDGDEEEEEIEMEIGFPTDVQHVAHIGWDGFNNSVTGSNTSMKRWDKGPDLLSLPAISLRQFELAMAAQTGGPH